MPKKNYKNPNRVRKENLMVKLTAEEKDAVQKKADDKGLSMSAYVRNLMLIGEPGGDDE